MEIPKGIPFFQGLSESEVGTIKQVMREKSFAKGDLLFHEGNLCERVFFVHSGRVKLYRTASSGREQILEMLGPGDTCACNPGSFTWFCSASAEAMTDCKVLFLSRDDYVRMVQNNHKLARTLNRLFADRLRCFTSLIEEVSLKDVKKRLAKFLLDMRSAQAAPGSKKDVKDVLSVNFTREELAQRIGTSRETVARYLYQLKRAKLIDILPKSIAILDEKGLRDLLS
ncbi:MAG: Crp/Fnr family transcriptional regulator [Candidatus Omnitrophica bacterium]|nr:Crp/Fnr family transcriptional regulator [Candidatus Omnitrophota bacterium]